MTAPGRPRPPVASAHRGYRAPLPPRPADQGPPFPWQLIAGLLFVAGMGLAAWLWIADPDNWQVGSGLVAIPLLTLLSFPLFVRAYRRGAGFDLAGLMATGLLLRFLAAFYRYDHRADAGVYHTAGSILADAFRGLRFGVDTGRPIPGTGGMRYVTGLVEVFTNGNEFATFLVFTWLAFVGCYLLYQAFVTALPDADHHRYALLIFLWPSLVLWPSSIGKECWMLFGLGIASYGAARVFVRGAGGYSLLVVGLLATFLVRPHVALVGLVGFGLALLIGRRRSDSSDAITPASVAKIAGLVLLLALGALGANRFGEYLDAYDINSVESAVAINVGRTTQGGSAFEGADPQNPIGYAEAAVTILARPFPFEASGTEQLASSAETILLAGLALASWRRVASIPFRLRRDPYIAYCVFLVLMFIFVLGTIANFGILARQRVQVTPFVFVLLSIVPRPGVPSIPARRAESGRT